MPESTEDLTDRIQEVAEGPASVSGDAGSVSQQSLSSLIEADKYLRSGSGVEKKGRGLRFTKLCPPGAV